MPKRIDVQRAAHDLHLRTLSKIPRALDRVLGVMLVAFVF
jgi:hypothetical protein